MAESYPSSGESVPIEIFLPKTSGPSPAVLIIHGSSGLGSQYRPDIVSFADALVEKGIAATLPHYFVSSNMKSDADGLLLIERHYETWKKACGEALEFMVRDTRFDTTRLGAIGFSLGGHFALSLGMDPPTGTSLKGVVDFFAPTLQPKLPDHWSALPPVLIHHGTDDRLSIENSRHVVRELAKVRRTVTPLIFGKPPQGPANDDQFIEYPNEGHGFKGAALAASRDATIQFLDTHLK